MSELGSDGKTYQLADVLHEIYWQTGVYEHMFKRPKMRSPPHI